LRHRIDHLAFVTDGHECRRRWEIPVPDIVMYALKVPEHFPSSANEGNQSVGKKIVANSVRTIKVGHGRASRHIHDASCLVDRHTRPVVGGTGRLPRALRPRRIAFFTGMRNCVKGPGELTGADVISANITSRGRVGLGGTKAEDQQVAAEHARGGQGDRVLCVVRVQVFAHVEPPIFTEGPDRLAGDRIECIQEVHDVGE
jgi:hypothetical protein